MMSMHLILLVAQKQLNEIVRMLNVVMPGLDPGIHVFDDGTQDVDGRVKPGHDGKAEITKCRAR
jgi:hypothetical protein